MPDLRPDRVAHNYVTECHRLDLEFFASLTVPNDHNELVKLVAEGGPWYKVHKETPLDQIRTAKELRAEQPEPPHWGDLAQWEELLFPHRILGERVIVWPLDG